MAVRSGSSSSTSAPSKTLTKVGGGDTSLAIPPRRVKLTVPGRDETVLKWLDEQDNASASVRHLIREYIRTNGVTDPLTAPVEVQAQAGRPTKAELDRRAVALSEALAAAGQTPAQIKSYLAASGLPMAGVSDGVSANTAASAAASTAQPAQIDPVPAPVPEPASVADVAADTEAAPVSVPLSSLATEAVTEEVAAEAANTDSNDNWLGAI